LVLDKANDPWRESLDRSGIGQSAYQVKDVETAAAAYEHLRAIGAAQRSGDAAVLPHRWFPAPHPPYVAWREDYRASRAVCRRLPSEPPSPPHAWKRGGENRGIADVDAEAVARARTRTTLVYRLDVLIGDVLRCLADEGLDDDT
jgi:hypothetical protein